MFGIGFAEVIVILVVMIIFIRPEDLPKTMRTLGRFYGKIKAIQKEIMNTKDQIIKEIDEAASIDCFAKGSYPALQGDKKGMNPETNTLPKQHTPSLQGGVVDTSPKKAAPETRDLTTATSAGLNETADSNEPAENENN